MGDALLVIGALSVVASIVLGFVAAPEGESWFHKLVWLRELSVGQGLRNLRLGMLVGGVLLVAASQVLSEGWLTTGLQKIFMEKTAGNDWLDWVLLFMPAIVSLAAYMLMDTAKKWPDKSTAARVRLVALAVIKYIVLLPPLAIVMAFFLFAVEKG
ncbi:hypothetical protein [Brachybacterium sp. p3-SID957]|uniref:hypothetical protein n=1 Tax=Brachybacterium sp. p3-SID957 TaxID=2916049 RepID=UPI00223B5176|nr:hypothetical protein [Brachybacterium sp. p3-SID957]MCT1777130.1 hypothetical protein [Brachybacterium sp. p3-SID957]